MAGLRGNQASLAWAKQTAKGSPNTTYAHNVPFSGGSIGPTRAVESLSETDANRDQGVSYISSSGVEGSPEVYVRGDNIHQLLEFALGSKATVGAADPYTHTLEPANSLPYVTFHRSIGATLFEQFEDCLVNELTISADAGSPLTASFDILGRRAVRTPVAPTLPDLADDAVYNFNEASVTLAGGATSLVSSFELTIANNVSTQQTDDVVPYDVVAGLREVTCGFSLIFETLAEYNRFHYGSTTGTTQSNTLATVALEFSFSKGVDDNITFTLPSVVYEEFPVEPDPGGDPIVVDVRARAQRGPDPVVTAVVENGVAT